MTENANALPPADWYPDPRDQSLQRYWDGQSWTAETRPVPGAAQPGPADAGGYGQVARTEPAAQEPAQARAAGVPQQEAYGQAGTGMAAGAAQQAGAGAGYGGLQAGAGAAPAEAAEPAGAGGYAFGGGVGGGLGGEPAGGYGAGGLGGLGGYEPVGQAAAEPVAAGGFGAAAAEPQTAEVLVVTAEQLPGHRISRVVGDVCGVAIRPAGTGSDQRALIAARREAVAALRLDATAAGGGAVIAMRFDSSATADGGTEVAAYGTAVVAEQA